MLVWVKGFRVLHKTKGFAKQTYVIFKATLNSSLHKWTRGRRRYVTLDIMHWLAAGTRKLQVAELTMVKREGAQRDTGEAMAHNSDEEATAEIQASTPMQAGEGDAGDAGDAGDEGNVGDEGEGKGVMVGKWRWERVSDKWVNAGGVLVAAVTLSLLSNGRLGESVLSVQLAATLIGLGLHRIALSVPLPHILRCIVLCIWVSGCVMPVGWAALLELLLGHRRAGMPWYSAVWRIYALLCVWIALCALYERVARPRMAQLRASIMGGSGGGSGYSMTAVGRDRDMARRDSRLVAIRERVAILLRRKKRLQAKLERAAALPADGARAADEMRAMADDVDDVDDQLRLRQMEWTDALRTDNYGAFYR